MESILKNIEQNFGGEQLYTAPHIKAAHLLYFITKDHLITDDNKRTGSLLFLLYLQLNNISLGKINDITLTALKLLIAQSDPAEKKLVINLIANIIA